MIIKDMTFTATLKGWRNKFTTIYTILFHDFVKVGGDYTFDEKAVKNIKRQLVKRKPQTVKVLIVRGGGGGYGRN